MKTYVTFGQVHVHSVNGKTFDKDSVAVIEAPTAEEGRKKAVQSFGLQFCTTYNPGPPNMFRYPRGLIDVEEVETTASLIRRHLRELEAIDASPGGVADLLRKILKEFDDGTKIK